MLGVQVATHLKGLARKAKLNEGHAKAARAYKARVASLTSKRSELRGQVQHMDEEAMKLKSDLKHTMSARARAEGMSRPESRSDPIGGSKPSSGCETQDWDSLPDFFFFFLKPTGTCGCPSKSIHI